MTIGLAYIPAIVFIGLAAFLQEDLIREAILPEYFEYYGVIGFAILLFTALRRSRSVVHRSPDRDAQPLSGIAAHTRYISTGQGGIGAEPCC